MFKKRNKGVRILLIILMIIVFAAAGIYYYVMSNFETRKFIEKNATLIKSTANIIDMSTSETSDLLKDDYVLEGNYKFNTTSSELSFLNNVELDVKSNVSISNEYIESDISLKQNDASLNANIALDSARLYLNSSNIFNGLLSYNLPSNIFKDIKDSIDNNSNISKSDINYIINKSVDYFIEALDQADMTTNYKGLTAEYKIVITKEAAIRIEDRFKTLVKKDERLSKYYSFAEKELDNTDTNDNTNKQMTIIIRQNMVNRLIESFEVDNGEKKLIGEKDASGNISVKEDNKVVLTIKKIAHGYEFENYKEGGIDSKITITINNKTLNLNISNTKEKTEIKVILKNVNDTINMTLNFVTADIKAKVDMNIKSEKEKTSFNGTATVTYNNNDLNLIFSQSYEKANNKIAKKQHAGATNVEYLTEQEQNEITTNLQKVLSKFKFYEYIISLLTPSDQSYANTIE